jgi:hypothetical protein
MNVRFELAFTLSNCRCQLLASRKTRCFPELDEWPFFPLSSLDGALEHDFIATDDPQPLVALGNHDRQADFP